MDVEPIRSDKLRRPADAVVGYEEGLECIDADNGEKVVDFEAMVHVMLNPDSLPLDIGDQWPTLPSLVAEERLQGPAETIAREDAVSVCAAWVVLFIAISLDQVAVVIDPGLVLQGAVQLSKHD